MLRWTTKITYELKDEECSIASRPSPPGKMVRCGGSGVPPHLVRDYLQRFNVTRRPRVLDPFCGTGTTVVECKKLGIPSVGIEANIFPHFAGQVKTDWTPDPNQLMESSRQIADEALAQLKRDGIEDDPLFRGWTRNDLSASQTANPRTRH